MALGGGIIPPCRICGVMLLSSPPCVCTIMTQWYNARQSGCDMETYFAFTNRDSQYEYVLKCDREQYGEPDPPDVTEEAPTF